MKKQIISFLFILFAGVSLAHAQGNFQRRTPEERAKRVVDTLTAVLKLDKTHADQTDSVFVNYYRDADKMRESMQGGNFDREAFMKLTSDRDEKLKKVLTPEEFKKFKDEIEPAMRPQRRQGGGGR